MSRSIQRGEQAYIDPYRAVRTSRVLEVARVDRGVGERIGRGDVDLARAERALQGELDADGVGADRETEQDLHMADSGRKQLCGGASNSLVTGNDSAVGAWYNRRRSRVNGARNIRSPICSVVAEQNARVEVGSSFVDVRQELGLTTLGRVVRTVI